MAAPGQRLQFSERDLTLTLDQAFGPEVMARELASFAKSSLRDYIRTQDRPPTWQTYVNAQLGVPEERVIPPGPIIYQFSWLRVVGAFGLDFLRARSPKKSGRYAERHFLMHDLRRMLPGNVPPSAEQIVLTNDEPYSRKIHTGAMKNMSVARYIFEDARQVILRRFGQVVEADLRFIQLKGGYTLQRDGSRKDRLKGAPMTYPAVVISLKE